MYNFLLDSLPEDYEGYLLRTDYRVGIQISQALEDDELSPQERLAVAFSLLYGNGTPPAEIAYQGLQWFLNGGNLPEQEEGQEDSGEEDPGIRFFSFDYDAARLYSGFRRMYGIDLDKIPMHWFRFLALLGDLGECAFTQVVHYRTADTSKMDKETRRTYLMMKRKYGLPQPESEESWKFMEKLRGGDGSSKR